MPIADNLDATKIMWNEAKVYIGVDLPANIAADIELDANGAPTGSGGIMLGLTRKETKCTYKFTKKDATNEQTNGAHATKIIAEEMTIEGVWLQVNDLETLARMSAGGGTFNTTSNDKVTFGGKTTVVTDTVLVVAPTFADPAEFICFLLYKGYNEAGVELLYSREEDAAAPFKFMGQVITTRVKGDQLGRIEIAPAG